MLSWNVDVIEKYFVLDFLATWSEQEIEIILWWNNTSPKTKCVHYLARLPMSPRLLLSD